LTIRPKAGRSAPEFRPRSRSPPRSPSRSPLYSERPASDGSTKVPVPASVLLKRS
jgi:hypothetical protein